MDRQYCQVIPLHSVRLTPCSSRYQLWHPPVFHTVVDRSDCSFSLNRSWAARVGASDVARVRDMARFFGDVDDLYGGGHARSAVAAYLVDDVVPLLRAASGPTRPDLFSAAAGVSRNCSVTM